MENQISILVNSFFEKLNIKIDFIEIIETENKKVYNIIIKSPESGILIGPEGKNLSHIQNILRIMVGNIIGKNTKLIIQVNDFKTSANNKLEQFIEKKIEKLIQNGRDIELPYYPNHERKIIHKYISDKKDKNIFTKSIGEGDERRLYICKKAKKLTIDIDGNDI